MPISGCGNGPTAAPMTIGKCAGSSRAKPGYLSLRKGLFFLTRRREEDKEWRHVLPLRGNSRRRL
jgi:hypothetical protein